MDQIGLEALKQGGIFGFITVAVLSFCGWLFHKTIVHFMKNVDKKDDLLVALNKESTQALNANTEAMTKLSITLDNVISRFEENSDKNTNEHGEILQFVRNHHRAN